MRVVLSVAANWDLTDIGDYIAQDNPSRAVSFVRELRDAARLIGNMPKAFPLLDGYEDRGIRRRPYVNYLLFYRIEAERVTVLRILHGARDYVHLI